MGTPIVFVTHFAHTHDLNTFHYFDASLKQTRAISVGKIWRECWETSGGANCVQREEKWRTVDPRFHWRGEWKGISLEETRACLSQSGSPARIECGVDDWRRGWNSEHDRVNEHVEELLAMMMKHCAWRNERGCEEGQKWCGAHRHIHWIRGTGMGT